MVNIKHSGKRNEPFVRPFDFLADTDKASRLRLTATPFAQKEGTITATVEGSNVSETVVELRAPDTVLISQPHCQIIEAGTFTREITWTVQHVQAGTQTLVEISASAGSLFQTALCRITGRH